MCLFSARNLEATIIHDLLDGYDPRAFPLDDDEPIHVNVSYFLTQLQGLVSILLIFESKSYVFYCLKCKRYIYIHFMLAG